MLKKFLVVVVGLLLLASLAAAADTFSGVYGAGPDKFTLATGSPGELGLLQALAAGFNKTIQGKATLQWIKAGSGKSLQLLKDRKVDMVMVHAPAAEKRRSRRAGPPTAPSSAPMNFIWSVRPAIRPKLLPPRAPSTPTGASPKLKPGFFPGGTIPAPTKKNS